jgi:hypothetical protein
MLPRVPERVLLPLAQLRKNHGQWFTQAEVADDLGVTTRTLRYWLKAMQDRGQGPSYEQIRIHRVNACHRIKRWRMDYWILIVRTFYTQK